MIYWHHNDHLGTPQALTDVNGTVVWTMSQTPFGIATVNEDPDGDGVFVTNNFRMPGQYFDQETGLFYNYFRSYDSSIGAYPQSDPIGLYGGSNTFAYVLNRPTSLIDPSGLKIQVFTRALDTSDLERLYAYAGGYVVGGLVGAAAIAYYERTSMHCVLIVDKCDGNERKKSTWDFQSDDTVYHPAKSPANPIRRASTLTVYEADDKDDEVERNAASTPGGSYDITNNNCCHWVERVLGQSGISWSNPNPWPFN